MSGNLIHKNASNYEFKEVDDLPDSRSILKQTPANNADKIKVHEFTRENIIPPFDDSVDHFAFRAENDIKYDFLKPKYFFSSQTMLKAFYWSLGIGTTFFLHRYYRKQIFWNSLRWGLFTMSTSFFFLWYLLCLIRGNFELQPFVMSYYYSNYITELSVHDLSKNLNENMKKNRNFEYYINMKKLPIEVIFEDSDFLTSFEKTIKELENKIIYKSNGTIDLNNITDEKLCYPDFKTFMKLENFDNYPDLTEGQIKKLSMLKKEIDNSKTEHQKVYIKECLLNAKKIIEERDKATLDNDIFYINVLE